MITLNAEQELAVQSDAPNIICRACPGSGKTRVLVERYAALVTTGTAPESVVVITYTVAAAKELKTRIAAHDCGLPAYVGTLHSYLLSLLRTYGRAVNISPNVAVADDETTERILKQCIEQTKWKRAMSSAYKAIEKLDSVDMPSKTLFHAFHRRLQKSSLISYDGILAYGLELLKNCPPLIPHIDHLMVDEFQDVSELDFSIYSLIPSFNRFYVGDHRQAIFGFRGGTPEPMNRLCGAWDWFTIDLMQNYRSGQAICDAANRLMHRAPGITNMTSGIETISTVETMHAAMPEDQMGMIGRTISDNHGTTAVLCRYNWHCDEITAYLRECNFKLVQRHRIAEPSGWRMAKTMVAFLSDPSNDELAFSVLCITQSEAAANMVRQDAMAKLATINAVSMRVEKPLLTDVCRSLVRANIPRESVELVQKAVDEMPVFSTISDLSAALQSGYLLEGQDGNIGADIEVCTIHAAKGREWDMVVLPYFNDQYLPGSKAENLEEARRLAFVAVTRAKNRLVLITTAKAKPYIQAHQMDEHHPSRFIKEMYTGSQY